MEVREQDGSWDAGWEFGSRLEVRKRFGSSVLLLYPK
jgi:hypothetical protein